MNWKKKRLEYIFLITKNLILDQMFAKISLKVPLYIINFLFNIVNQKILRIWSISLYTFPKDWKCNFPVALAFSFKDRNKDLIRDFLSNPFCHKKIPILNNNLIVWARNMCYPSFQNILNFFLKKILIYSRKLTVVIKKTIQNKIIINVFYDYT